MNRTYEIRTRSGAAVFAFDDISRAKQELARAEMRLKIPLCLFEITRAERDITHAEPKRALRVVSR